MSVFGSGDYDPKNKNVTVACLADCAVVSVFGSGGKLAVSVFLVAIVITTGKKKVLVVFFYAKLNVLNLDVTNLY